MNQAIACFLSSVPLLLFNDLIALLIFEVVSDRFTYLENSFLCSEALCLNATCQQNVSADTFFSHHYSLRNFSYFSYPAYN